MQSTGETSKGQLHVVNDQVAIVRCLRSTLCLVESLCDINDSLVFTQRKPL